MTSWSKWNGHKGIELPSLHSKVNAGNSPDLEVYHVKLINCTGRLLNSRQPTRRLFVVEFSSSLDEPLGLEGLDFD